MNADARDLLVAAALRGHRQIRHLHDDLADTGECAMGILHLERHVNRAAALACRYGETFGACLRETGTRFGISWREGQEIRDRNDRGEDFLTIANKVGTDG